MTGTAEGTANKTVEDKVSMIAENTVSKTVEGMVNKENGIKVDDGSGSDVGM